MTSDGPLFDRHAHPDCLACRLRRLRWRIYHGTAAEIERFIRVVNALLDSKGRKDRNDVETA